MESRKDIGKAISDKLNSLDKTPRENVWNGIKYELQKKKKRRIAFFFFWTKTIGLLLIGVLSALYVFNQNQGFNNHSPIRSNESVTLESNAEKTKNAGSKEENMAPSVKTSELNSTSNKPNPNTDSSEDSNGNTRYPEGSNSNVKSVKNNRKKVFTTANGQYNLDRISSKNSEKQSNKNRKTKSKKADVKMQSMDDYSNRAPENTTQTNSATFDLLALQKNDSINKTKELRSKKSDSLIAKKDKEKTKNINMYPEDKKEKDSTKTYRKIAFDAFVSPTYQNYFSNESNLSRFLNSNSKTTEIVWNYGAGVSYELSEKIAVRLSYTKVKFIYTTNNAEINTPNYSGIGYNPNTTNQTIYADSNNASYMNITQHIAYNDISLEARYKFSNHNFGINGIFGFGLLVLNENSIEINTDNGFTQTIGKTKSLFETGASVNVGFGLDYPIFKSTKVFFEPMFNYQVMSSENSNNKPYYIGLHFGIRYTLNNSDH